MSEALTADIVARAANGVTALIAASTIAWHFSRKESRSKFLLFWCFGFAIWGVQILLRLQYSFGHPLVVLTVLVFSFFMLLGTSMVARGATLLLPAYSVVMFFVAGIYLTLGAEHPLFLASGLGYFVLMTVAVSLTRYQLGKAVNLLAVGWAVVLLGNVFLALNSAVADLVAMAGKIMFLVGIIHPKYLFMANIRASIWGKHVQSLRKMEVEPIRVHYAIIEAIEQALSTIGPHVPHVVLYHLEKTHNISRDSLVENPALFKKALRKLIGPAAEIVERRTIEALQIMLDIPLPRRIEDSITFIKQQTQVTETDEATSRERLIKAH